MKLIKLSQGKFAKVDDEDYEKVSAFTWSAANRQGRIYAVSGSNYYGGKQLNLHRLVMNVPDDRTIFVDHKNHDTLDCQKSNLRLCTNQQYQYNQKKKPNTSSKYKGVHKVKDSNINPWSAGIRIDKKKVYLGRFKTEEEAAYLVFAFELYYKFQDHSVVQN